MYVHNQCAADRSCRLTSPFVGHLPSPRVSLRRVAAPPSRNIPKGRFLPPICCHCAVIVQAGSSVLKSPVQSTIVGKNDTERGGSAEAGGGGGREGHQVCGEPPAAAGPAGEDRHVQAQDRQEEGVRRDDAEDRDAEPAGWGPRRLRAAAELPGEYRHHQGRPGAHQSAVRHGGEA